MTRTVLVTGSSRGIGRAIAQRLADEGYRVVLHCRNQRQQAEQILEHICATGGSGRILQFDVGDREQCRLLLEADIASHGAYYGVVCNAGITRDNAFPALSDDDWDDVIHTNLDGFYNILRPVIMPMVRTRQGGRIVSLSSVSGLVGNRGQVNYSAAKAGIIGASKALALELAKRRITVNCVAPGLIRTDMVDETIAREAAKAIPLRRIGEAREVAALVAFLMSEDAAYITRQVISVNGGMA